MTNFIEKRAEAFRLLEGGATQQVAASAVSVHRGLVAAWVRRYRPDLARLEKNTRRDWGEVINAAACGESYSSVAARVGVSKPRVQQIVTRHRREQATAAGSASGAISAPPDAASACSASGGPGNG